MLLIPTARQLFDDMRMRPVAKEVFWRLLFRLDLVEWRPVKVESLGTEARLGFDTTGRALKVLVSQGYLERRASRGRLQEYRLPFSRRAVGADALPRIAAPATAPEPNVTGLPCVLAQAMWDAKLTPVQQRVMWIICHHLDVAEWRPMKVASVALDAHLKFNTVACALRRIQRRGYVEARQGVGRLREYRLPHSRREVTAPAKLAPDATSQQRAA